MQNFIKLTNDIEKITDKQNIIIGIEATGNLWRHITYFLIQKGFKVVLLNPLYTHKFTDLISNKTKTDKIDAISIAKYLKTNEFKKSIIPDSSQVALKSLVKLQHRLQNQIYNQKRLISTIILNVFYEFSSLFKNVFSITAITLLKNYPSFKKIASLKPLQLVKLFRNIKGNNFNIQKAKLIIDTAKNSITPDIDIEQFEFILLNQIQLLQALIKAKKEVDDKINNNLKQINSNYNKNTKAKNVVDALLSIPGVGNKTVAAIIGLCGDLSKFSNAKKFIGYVGLYPQIIQSGKKNFSKSHKKGIPILKKYIHISSVACLRHNKELRKIYLDAISNGKSPQKALMKVKYKLLKIIWHLYNHNENYIPYKVFVN